VSVTWLVALFFEHSFDALACDDLFDSPQDLRAGQNSISKS